MKSIKYEKVIHVIISAAIGLLILFLFTHCNTVHKSTQSLKQTTDSVHVVKIEAATVSNHDSVILKETKGDYTRETVIEFDSSEHMIYNDDGAQGDFGLLLKRLSNSGSKITIRETGNYQTKDLGTYSNYDSTASKQIDSAIKHQTVEVKNTDKKSSRLPIGLIIGVVALLAVVFVVIYLARKFKV